MRKKKKKEEGSLGPALIPRPLPYQGTDRRIKHHYQIRHITRSQARKYCYCRHHHRHQSRIGTNVLGSKPSHGSSSFFVNWLAFQDYLSKTCNNSNTAQVRMCYAKKFYHVLFEEDAHDLLAIESKQKRLSVMKSLTILSFYLECYDTWQQIRKRNNLKWTAGNESLLAMHWFFNTELSLDVMFSRIKDMVDKLPTQMGQIIKFGRLVGLRPSEVAK